jgi:hypothetical protein
MSREDSWVLVFILYACYISELAYTVFEYLDIKKLPWLKNRGNI